MGTLNPNQTLLQSKNQSESDQTPAPLANSSSLIKFAFQGVQPPSLLYVDVDDQLIMQSASSTTNELVTVNVRLLKPDGRIEDMQFQIRPANTRVSSTVKTGLAQGYILSISAVCAQAITRGQTFLRLSTQRAASGTGNPAQMLFADYVTTLATSAYPNGRVLSPTEGPGWLNVVTVANPGAGLEFQVNVPANARWRVQCLNYNFLTSGVAGNRIPSLTVQSSAGTEFQSGLLAVVVATTNVQINAAALTPYVNAFPGQVMLEIPTSLFLGNNALQSMFLKTLTSGILAGDNYTAITVLVEEWLDNV